MKEHINSLQAMKLSPYYKVFEEDAAAWEEKLNKINSVFDVWIDVQRRWVYLDGIFSGSSDIQALLPNEYLKFHNQIDFPALMKKVAKNPKLIEVVNMHQIQRSLERNLELLIKIQKALGEYLETQRSSFPRFYFVGDEDLLDILGNSKNLLRVQKHLKKMFAGVTAMSFGNEDQSSISGITSKEGEEVRTEMAVILGRIFFILYLFVYINFILYLYVYLFYRLFIISFLFFCCFQVLILCCFLH